MSTIVGAVTQALSVLTMLMHVFLIVGLIYFLLRFFSKAKLSFFENILNLIRKKFLLFSFIVALTATLGSLFFSEIALYDPCRLCWFQRIFMYPLVILFGIALFKDDKKIIRYALPLSMIGICISAYHYTISTFSKVASSGVCSATGPSCLVDYFTEYGYVTIPLMAFTAFLLIIIFNLLSRKRQ
jgi:disulfide bond formation protein DsbB